MQIEQPLVLVVDDDSKIISLLTKDILPYHGYKCISAQTGQRAWQLIVTKYPDAILMDVQLPDINGLNLVEQLRRQDKVDTPIIMMTAFGTEETAVRALRLGVQDYLIKPFTHDQAIKTLNQAVEKSRLQRELRQKVEELSILEAIGRDVASNLDLDTVLNRIVEAGTKITQAGEGYLMLLDEATNELHLRAQKNLGKTDSQSIINDERVLQVLQAKRPFKWGKVGDIGTSASILHVPLITENSALGVLSVQNSTRRRSYFSEGDMERLKALAVYAVIALQNDRHYQALINAQEKLTVSETVARMGMFGSIWAHSMHQETSSIRMYLEALRHYISSADARDLLLKADNVAVALQNIPITEELPTDVESVNPLQIDKTLKHEVENLIYGQPNIELVFELQCPGIKARIDKSWLDVVIEMLIKNALRAMPEGGTLKIMSTVNDKHQINIDFLDQGQGIPEHYLPYFLNRRIPKQPGETGTGMGILIARYIVEWYGGKIMLLSSEANKGTAIRVTMPVVEQDQETDTDDFQ